MDTGKLKNIVLLILLGLNLAFGSLLLVQRVDEAQEAEHTRSDLGQVLRQLGITLEASLPQQDSLCTWTVNRDPAAEARFCEGLLGTASGTAQGGNIWYYESDSGWAWFRAASFELLLRNSGLELEAQLRDSGVRVRRDRDSYLCQWDDAPVFNCRFAPTLRDGGIYLSGRLLTGTPLQEQQLEAPDAATALLRFHDLVQAAGGIYTVIQEIAPGYVLLDSAASMELAPVWRFSTDGGVWYLGLEALELVTVV